MSGDFEIFWLVLIVVGCGVVTLLCGMLTLVKAQWAQTLRAWAIPFAGGALLAAALLCLIPHAIKDGDMKLDSVMLYVLLGFVGFFVLGYLLNLVHKHGDTEKGNSKRAASMMVVVDVIEKFVDGMVIGVSFALDPVFGLVMAGAVLAHEIPMEIGDFAILIKSKMPMRKMMTIQILQVLMMVPGAILAYYLGIYLANGMAVLMAAGAGFFIYLAASEVIPNMQRSREKRVIRREIVGVVLGAVVLTVILRVTHSHDHHHHHHYHDCEHSHSHSHDHHHDHGHDHDHDHGHNDDHHHHHDEYDEHECENHGHGEDGELVTEFNGAVVHGGCALCENRVDYQ